MSTRLVAHGIKHLALIESKPDVKFQAAGDTEETKLPRIDFTAYNGGKLKLAGAYWPVIFDLASTKTVASTPFLANHDTNTVVGHVDKLDIAVKTVKGSAVMSGVNDKVNEIKATAANGFPWQISLGVDSNQLTFIPSGESVRANGRTHEGPAYLAQDNVIREVSILSLAADDNTVTSLSACYNGGSAMFENWVTQKGFDPATLTEGQKATLTAAYDTEQKQKAKEEEEKKEKERNGGKTLDELLQQDRLKASREYDRINRIKDLATQYDNPTITKDGKKLAVASIAINEQWDENKTEVEMLKAARPKVASRDGGDEGTGGIKLLAAAFMQAGKIDRKELENNFDKNTLQQAHDRYKSRIGLQEFLYEAARANGYHGSMNFKANAKEMLRAAFSSIEVPTVLTTNFNTYLMAGYNAVDQSWRLIAKRSPVSDFKTITNLRVNGSLTFQELAPDGHIPHGKLSEQTYTNKAKPRGIMLAITFVDIVNDNLGAFADNPRMIGRGGALGLVRGFWTEFLDNSAFFAAGNSNVSTGVLGVAGLNSALAVFRKLKDATGEYVLGTPRYLLAPAELEATAQALYSSSNLVVGTTAATGPADNPHVGKFQPVITPFLSDSAFTGYSTTAYYLLADPQDVPGIEVVFLDGVETPLVESADADFDQLGIQLRGTFHWGVKKQDPNCGVRSTGA